MATAPAMPKTSPHLPKAAPYLVDQDYAAYTTEQHGVWAELVRRRMPQLEEHAAQEYLDGFETLCLPYDRLPNLGAVSAKLEVRTGWNTTPVSGFMPAPAFF
jgi:phenylalanine-4-hydroxylase